MADAGTGAIADPETLVWRPMGGVDTTLEIVQVKEAVAEYPASSVAVRSTAKVPAVVGVPLTVPDVGSTDRPGGSVPPSDHATVAAGRGVGGARRDRGDRRARHRGLVTGPGGRHHVGHHPVEGVGRAVPGIVGGRDRHREGPTLFVGVPVTDPLAGSTESPGGRVPPSE